MSFTLTACTLQDLPVVGQYFGGGKASGSITFWGLWENRDVVNALINNYQNANPNVTVTYEDRSILNPNDYRERIFARAEENLGVDVVLIHNTWVSSLKDSLTPAPSGVFSAQDYSSAFYPVASDSAVLEGKVYAVPFYYDGLVLLYNKDHFDEIGQIEPPTSWEEFRRLALRLTIRSGEGEDMEIVRSGAAIGNADNIEHFSDLLGLMFSQTGVTVPANVDTTAAAEALDFYTTFYKTDQIWDETMPEANTAFAQNKVSMIFVPSWRILDILEANPTLNFGVAPVPQALPNKPASWASFWMLAVPATSKNPTAAWDFIKFITSEEQELALFSEASKFRPFGAPYARTSLAAQIANDPFVSPVLETAPNAKSGYITARSGNDNAVKALKDAVNAVLNKYTDSQTALKNFKEGKAQPTSNK